MDGELAGAGAEDVAGDADVVSQVQQLVELETLLAHGIQADVDLQPFAALLQMGKAGLALRRMAMMRPATVTTTRLASSSSPVLAAYSARIWGTWWLELK